MSNLNLSNAEILRAIATVAGVSRNGDWDETFMSDARDVIRSGLRKFYNPVDLEGRPWQWRFLDRTFFATGTAEWSDGTIDVADGVVTLAGATFPGHAADCLLFINGQLVFVSEVTSPTTLKITNDGVLASDQVPTLIRWRYPFPDDFTEILDRRIIYSADAHRSVLLRNTNTQEIRARWASMQRGNDPSACALLAGTDGIDPHRMYLAIWPGLDTAASLSCTYRSHPGDKLAVDDLREEGSTIQAPAAHAETLKAAIQAAAEDHFYDQPGSHNMRFQERLQASIKYDRHAAGQFELSGNRPHPNPRALALLYHVPIYEV